jgi:hypothetical protein
MLRAYSDFVSEILNFKDYGEGTDLRRQSLEKLKKLMSSRAFRRYVEENPDFFSVE